MTAPKRKAIPSPAKGEPRRRVDWDAVERDYRTGKFTLRELESKHGANNSTILRRANKSGWTQDLSAAVKQATNARLIGAIVAAESSKAQQNAADTVLAAAEVNARVILGHRRRLSDLAAAVDAARAKVLALGDSVADIREAATFAQAVGNLATATKTLIAGEREAHNIGDGGEAPGTEQTKRITLEFVDVQR